VIKFENITKIYPSNLPGMQPTVALEGISFEIKPKEFVSIVGKSGAGKTTLLKLLLAEQRPTSGKIFFQGIDIYKVDTEDLPQLRRKIGAVFQDYKLLTQKTA
jgi:cell division transport system ATP-binding protein